jgi:hypothetical protein
MTFRETFLRPGTLTTVIVVALVVNVVDAVIHIVTDQVEPLRIASNAVVILAAALILAVPALNRQMISVTADVLYLGLNVLFIVLNGIGGLGLLLVVVTVVLLSTVSFLQSARSQAAT